jgi:hypothetical protein
VCSLDKFNLAQLDFTIKSFFCYSKVAQNNNLQFFETSAKTGDGVKEVVSIFKKTTSLFARDSFCTQTDHEESLYIVINNGFLHLMFLF